MNRDFICVVGNQGAGKSVWSKQFSKSKSRLLVYDPMASYPVDFTTDPEKYLIEVANNKRANFAFGTYLPDELPLFGRAAYGAGDCLLVIEECGFIFSRGSQMEPWLSRLVFMGRHAEVSLLFVAQRAASIPISVRSQASRIITFRQTEPEDVKAITERIGRQYRDELPALPDLACLDWEGGTVKRYSVAP